MAEDRDWADDAQVATLRAEVTLLRGAVAALRATRGDRHAPERPARGWAIVLFAFAGGALVVLVVLSLYPQAICP
jgi:hypothetical protein